MSVVVERRGFSLPLGVSPEAEIFAVGDIHGRSDLLAALIDEAAREPKLRDKRTIVFLGDLVDRGPDSLGAIDLAMAAKARVGADEAIALMGNHETMMRLALDPETPWDDAIDAFDTWIANGGDRTVAEFVKTEQPPDYLDDLLTEARASLPPRIRAWLASSRASWRSGQVLFVHAGVNPEVELETFLAAPWNMAARQARRRSSLGVGAPAVPRPSSGAGGLQRLLRRPRPHAERRPSRGLARGSDRRIPPQSRRRFSDDRGRQNGGDSRPRRGGGQRPRTDQLEAHGG